MSHGTVQAVKVQSQCFSARALSHDVPDAAQDDRELRSIKRLYKMNVDTDALKIQGGVAFAAQVHLCFSLLFLSFFFSRTLVVTLKE